MKLTINHEKRHRGRIPVLDFRYEDRLLYGQEVVVEEVDA